MVREIAPRVVSWELGPEVARRGRAAKFNFDAGRGQAGKPDVRRRSTATIGRLGSQRLQHGFGYSDDDSRIGLS